MNDVRHKMLITCTETMILNFLRPHIDNLLNKKFKVDIACSNVKNRVDELKEIWGDSVEINVVSASRSPNKLIKNLKAYKEIRKIIQNGEYDLIWTNEPVMGTITRLASRNNNAKVMYIAHGFHFYQGAPLINCLLYKNIENWLAQYTDALVTINAEDYKTAQSFRLKKNGKVYYISGIGIDVEKYKNICIDRYKKRKEIGVPEENIMLLSVGELNNNKNHQIVIKALSKSPDLERITYCICGKGKDKEKLQKLASELGVQRQIKFLEYRNDIEEVMQCADIFIHPSKREGLPVALMEAMASGLLIACSDVRGNVDLISDKTNGLLFNPEESEEILAILSYFDNESLKKNFKEFNLKKIQNYDIEVIKNNIYKICLETLNLNIKQVEC